MYVELGGNAPFVVFEDADIDQAVAAAMASKFRNAGQTCVCADRFLVHSLVHDEFVDKLVDRVGKLRVGPGIEAGTTMGPVITSKAAQEIHKKVNDAIADGANCVVGGSRLESLGPNFLEATVLTNVSTDSNIWKTETFGPVAAIRSFDTEEEALALANDADVGLAAYFCTQNLSRVFRFASRYVSFVLDTMMNQPSIFSLWYCSRLENGIVGVNEGVISTCSAPFGGVKESGLGREGSQMGLAEYVETKYIFINY
jgi:acyl-CoA reductase-like NAD-dependent aldehyde dehydrogenase